MKAQYQKNFILIFSFDNDQSTSDIMDWLLKKKEKIVRVKNKNDIKIVTVSVESKCTNIAFEYDSKILHTQNIKSFWYRRGAININQNYVSQTSPQIAEYLNEEKNAVIKFFLHELDKKARINHSTIHDVNKLLQLSVAQKCNLKIPKTFLSGNLHKIKQFLNENKNVITKSIEGPFVYYENGSTYCLMTENINLADLKNRKEDFFITKFQEQIAKQFELRIFYVCNRFYSMAIFSQSNEKTKVDFRKYDTSNPNRNIPFELPKEISSKLRKLMLNLGLTSGSIDMIVDCNDNYYFLEVNPVGQFGMVSYPCNYNLEEKIASTLSLKN